MFTQFQRQRKKPNQESGVLIWSRDKDFFSEGHITIGDIGCIQFYKFLMIQYQDIGRIMLAAPTDREPNIYRDITKLC